MNICNCQITTSFVSGVRVYVFLDLGSGFVSKFKLFVVFYCWLLQGSKVIGNGTFGCGSTIVEGEDFIAENIAFENSSPEVYNCVFSGVV
jgi:hypothetical protein